MSENPLNRPVLVVEKPLNHQVLIVRVPEPRVHTNADSLELFDILGYQVVAKKGNFKAGELAIYIQPDSVIPQTEPFRFIWEPYAIGGIPVNKDILVPEKRRRITVRKFRKEWSEGLLMPLADFMDPYNPKLAPLDWKEGEDVSDLLSITHYEPEEEASDGNIGTPTRKPRRPTTLKGWLRFFWYRVLHITRIKRQKGSQAIPVPFDAPYYDVESMKAARTGFAPGERVRVTVTEKLHGSNARFVFLDGVFYIGSRFQWKAPNSPNIFTRVAKQQPWIESWCRANEGRVLYGEIIGDQKGFHYGLDKSKGELDFRAFDIYEPNGTWMKPFYGGSSYCGLGDDQIVPILLQGVATIEVIKSLTDGVSLIDGKTQREGIVISAHSPAAFGHRRPQQVKLVSNVFLEKDSK